MSFRASDKGTQQALVSGWSEEQVRRLLEDDRSYQRVDLPYGLSTKGTDRFAACELILPDDLTGKSVLDVGCSYGYFCFEALKRGARWAVGVDVDRESIRMAKLIAQCLDSPAEFRHLNIDEDELGEQFDYVLCLNVLHDLRNPLAVLDKLIASTRERLILETAAIGRHERRELGIGWLAGAILNSTPVILVGGDGSARHPEQRFLITAPAVENFLRYKVLANVRTIPSDFKDRFITIAEKRRIGHLVVIAGPTSVGKSTIISRLKAGELPEIARAVGMDHMAAWRKVDARSLHRLSESTVEHLILHYDFSRPYYQSVKAKDRDEALSVLEIARQVTFVTLVAEPEELRRRIEKSEIRPKTKLGLYRGSERYLRIRKDYEDPARVRSQYERWLDFCQTRAGQHILVSSGEDVRWYPAEKWEEVAEKHGLTPRNGGNA